jgi:hypothetical protein
MAKDTNIYSASITNLDAIDPSVAISAGQGGATRLYEVDDYAACTAGGIATAGSYYRMVRFPTSAIIKSFVFATDVAVDTSATASLALDFNIAFSDSTIDGTPSNYQALVPTTALGGATTTFASYSSPNKMFGAAVVQPTANAAWAPTDYWLKGITSTFTVLLVTQQPLWQTFGFTAAAGQNQNPGGNFDMTAYVATAAGTGHAGNLIGKVTYAGQ